MTKYLAIIASCADQIAVFPDQISYPSAAYLMRILPEDLHDVIPIRIDGWKKPHSDRKTKIEFTYRPARSLAEWREYAAIHEGEICSYTLDQVPWYRSDYKWDESDSEDSSDEGESEDDN